MNSAAANTYIKHRSTQLVINPYKVQGAGESSLDLDELILSMRRIPAQSEDILNAIGLDGGEGVVDLLDGHIRAGEVHHGLDAHHVLHAVGDLQRQIRRGSAGSPSDVAERRVVRHHPLHSVEQVVDTVLRLRREELEGEHHPVVIGARRLPDLLYHLHLLTTQNQNNKKIQTNSIQILHEYIYIYYFNGEFHNLSLPTK